MVTKKDCVFRAAMELYEDEELSQMAADGAAEKNFVGFKATIKRGITLLKHDLDELLCGKKEEV